jgi:hypothetical protein
VSGLLRHPPTEPELERLYHELAVLGAPSIGRRRTWPYRPRSREALLALAGEMLRYDARLLSILLQYLLAHWAEINPLQLRAAMRSMRWPQALLVVLEFAKAATSLPELRYLVDYLGAGFARVEPAERFFLDAERPSSRMAQRALGRNLQAYSRWGFIGHEKPIVDATTKRTVGRYDSETRLRILSELAATADSFSLVDYLAAVDYAVSRQQALIDLRSVPNLEPTGHGRGARWRHSTQRRSARRLT